MDGEFERAQGEAEIEIVPNDRPDTPLVAWRYARVAVKMAGTGHGGGFGCSVASDESLGKLRQ
jgi:hypothetical protein